MCIAVRQTKQNKSHQSSAFQPIMLSDLLRHGGVYQLGQQRKEYGDSDDTTVKHDYHDHANEPSEGIGESSFSAAAVTKSPLSEIRAGTPFPQKLFYMLDKLDEEGLSHIASWQPHGRCFLVHNASMLTEILPRFFKLSKVSSFQRQLNLYGFKRLSKGMDKGSYYNEYFLRQRADLLKNITRIRVKGTGVRGKSNPDEEPDFWTMQWVGVGTTSSDKSDNYSLISNEISSTGANVGRQTSMGVVSNENKSSTSMCNEEQITNPIEVSTDEASIWGRSFHKICSCYGQQLQASNEGLVTNLDEAIDDAFFFELMDETVFREIETDTDLVTMLEEIVS